MLSEDQERDISPVTVHHSPDPNYGVLDPRIYYPTNVDQIRDLLGKVLTHLDALNLPERPHKAAKTLIMQEIWRWWDSVYDSSTTSVQGCIAPVVMAGDEGRRSNLSNRWNWGSESAWLTTVATASPSEAP